MDNILQRYPGLVCPACCISDLGLNHDKIFCRACDTQYELLDDKYPILITPNGEICHEEISIQDQAAIRYETGRYQNTWARAYHDWWTELMISHVDVTGRILDNGCGAGKLFECLPKSDIIGLDLSTEMIRVAGTKNRRVLVSDSHQLPFSDGSFDTIFARSLLHHMTDFHKGILEMARVLRTGGEIVSVDTNKSMLSTLPRRVFGGRERFSNEHKNFERNELVQVFSKYLKVEHVSFFGYVAYPILGFPDIADIFRFFPFKKISYKILTKIDSLLECLPWIRTQGWAILIKARKTQTK